MAKGLGLSYLWSTCLVLLEFLGQLAMINPYKQSCVRNAGGFVSRITIQKLLLCGQSCLSPCDISNFGMEDADELLDLLLMAVKSVSKCKTPLKLSNGVFAILGAHLICDWPRCTNMNG